jgi:Ribbon-helix-helix protein, copG family
LKFELDKFPAKHEDTLMQNKRTTSFYLTDEALEALEEVAKRWGVGRNAVVEIAARLMRDNPSIFFRMVAQNRILIPEDEEETE